MNVSNSTENRTGRAFEVINRRKVADLRKYNMERIEHALNDGVSIKLAKRKLGIGKRQMYALRNKESHATTNMGKIVKVAEEFYRDLNSSRHNQDDNGRRRGPEELDIPPVTPNEVKNTLDAMKRGKAADLLKDGERIALESLATLYTQ